MASDNETVADIVREMVEFGNHCAAFGGAYSPERWDNLCKRLNAANKRALDAKDDERLTVVANYENVIAAKDREIAELRECLREAVREKCPFTRMSCKHDEPCDYECGTKKWRNALEGEN